MAYHAFESLGGAVLSYRGKPYSFKHGAKLNSFKSEAKVFGRPIQTRVAELCIVLASVRSSTLYPEELPHGVVARPSMRFTVPQARRLIGRVKSLLNRVAQAM